MVDSRIDSFLDASLVFARGSQIYLLALREQDLPPALPDGWGETFPRAFSDRARLAAAFGAALLDSTCAS